MQTEKLLKQLFKTIAPIYHIYGTNSQKSLCERFFKSEEKITHKMSVALLNHIILRNKVSFTREDLISGDETRVDDESFVMSIKDYAKKMNKAIQKDKGVSTKNLSKEERKREFHKAKEQFRAMRITEALKILRCNRLIKKVDNQYRINEELWSKDVVYRIKHHPTLASLSNLIFSYIKNEAYLGANDFFKETDKLISAVIKPSITHNQTFQQEFYVAKRIEQMETVYIQQGNFKVEVFPRAVEIGEAGKYFTYEELESPKMGEAPLNLVILPSR